MMYCLEVSNTQCEDQGNGVLTAKTTNKQCKDKGN